MKKFIATGNFEGQVEVVYGEHGLLHEVKYGGAQLSHVQLDWLQQNLPTVLDAGFAEFAKRSKLTWIEERYEISFEVFWEAYGLKHNKKRCEAKWNRMSKADRVKAYMGLAAYFRHLQLNPWKNKAGCDTYLEDRYYDTDWSKMK